MMQAFWVRTWPSCGWSGNQSILTYCPAVVTEEDVEKRVHISEQIEEKLESRPNQDEMLKANEHIINPSGGFHWP